MWFITCMTSPSAPRSLLTSAEVFMELGRAVYRPDCSWKAILFCFWLCWVFLAARRLSLAVASRGCSSFWFTGFSIAVASLVAKDRLWVLGLQQLQQRCSVVVAHRLSCSAACGIFPDQRLNPCPLCSQVDSCPLHHQGSPGKQSEKTHKKQMFGSIKSLPCQPHGRAIHMSFKMFVQSQSWQWTKETLYWTT